MHIYIYVCVCVCVCVWLSYHRQNEKILIAIADNCMQIYIGISLATVLSSRLGKNTTICQHLSYIYSWFLYHVF